MKDIKLIYFSLTNENTSNKNNIKYWQDYFKGNNLSQDVTDYIKEAKEIIDYHNLNDKEHDMMEKLTKAEAIYMAEMSTMRRQSRKEGKEEGLEEGIEIGIEDGIEIAKSSVIKNLAGIGMDLSRIAQVAEVSEDYVRNVLGID